MAAIKGRARSYSENSKLFDPKEQMLMLLRERLIELVQKRLVQIRQTPKRT